MSGQLYLCATPIGNLGDITLRVLETLKSVDIIAAEDTRNTKKLLNYYNINTPLTSYHEHNKYEKGKKIVDYILNGKNIALVSDAGTPGISDPGEELVYMCYEEGITVTALPGAVAAITALTISGLGTKSFVFEGFLSGNKRDRIIQLDRINNETRTIILYEAPHKLKKTLLDLKDVIDLNRKVSICKEITKKHEKVIQKTLQEMIHFYEINEPKGEYVIVIEGKNIEIIEKEKIQEWEKISIEEHMNYYLEQSISKKDAMKKVAKDRGLSKRDIYNYCLKK